MSAALEPSGDALGGSVCLLHLPDSGLPAADGGTVCKPRTQSPKTGRCGFFVLWVFGLVLLVFGGGVLVASPPPRDHFMELIMKLLHPCSLISKL